MVDGITSDGKMGKSILRIWFPLMVFAIFMTMVIGRDELYSRFLSNFSGVGRVIFEYGSQMGVWFSGARLASDKETLTISTKGSIKNIPSHPNGNQTTSNRPNF